MPEQSEQPDLAVCDNEPITRLDLVQSFGFLIALTNDWTIVRVSANVDQHLGWTPDEVLGSNLTELIGKSALHDIRNRMALLYSTQSERLYGTKLLGDSRTFDLALHFQWELLILEGEPSQKSDKLEAASMVRAMAARLTREESLETFHRTAARQIQAITGFDRVMIYRFDHDGHGEVIAESVRAGMESFLGLHYPASDVPKQARALYLLNPFRIIADVLSAPVPILPPLAGAALPLDLSLAVTRAVSPVHIEYLRNMGVGASLSISIIVNGALWGLITCHAKDARLPSFVMRSAAELFGAMYSLILSERLSGDLATEEQHARHLADRLITAIVGNENLLSNAEWLQNMITDVIRCDGVSVFRVGTVVNHGQTPDDGDVLALARHLDIHSPSRVFATDHLTGLHQPCRQCSDRAAGMLAIPISRQPRDYVMLFRRERRANIAWGGDPNKAMELSDDGSLRMSPRKSFAKFMQLVEGRSEPFSAPDLRIAEAVRQALTEVILRYADGANEERRRAQERQELLIAELNHRVRNILSLIRGLITQADHDNEAVHEYVEALNGRVQALARAHDRITRMNWGPAPFASLFDDEIAALPGARGRLVVDGPEIWLHPAALSTMALVVHELVTNSCKYGALAETGRVDVTVERLPGYGATIRWREREGPPVSAPTRRGFGSTIIERMVPFDLQGTSDLRFALSGLELDLSIPERWLARPEDVAAEPAVTTNPVSAPSAGESNVQPLKGQSVLIVEDNLLIAMEAEDMVQALGAERVELASTIEKANQLVQAIRFDFALLDINLGQSTTFELAKRLQSTGTHFVFASGYGEAVGFQHDLTAPIVLQKPYQCEHLREAVVTVLEMCEARS